MTSASPPTARGPVRQIRVLLLTYFFPPDQTPGAFRSKALLDAMLSSDSGGPECRVAVDVVTTQPHRNRVSKEPVRAEETGEGYRIRRVDIPRNGPGFTGQARAFLAFARQVNAAVANTDYDIVVATTSRQMTGMLGAWIAQRKGIPLYLDIRDLCADNFASMFHWSWRPVSWLLSRSERWMLARAARVNAVSVGFRPYLERLVSTDKLAYFPNGVDDLFTGLKPSPTPSRSGGPLEIVYAGNIGAGQALDRIVPELASRLEGRARFTIIGDGRHADLLREAIDRRKLSNVTLLGPVSRERLPEVYSKADILFLHLKEAASLRSVLPSKLFEYAATGLPILAGVSGYTEEFIKTEIENAAVFRPGDAEGALSGLRTLDCSLTDRADFGSKFARSRIMLELSKDIFSLVKEHHGGHGDPGQRRAA